MTGDDLIAAAVTELYSADPDEFVGRRGDLAAAAREAGETAAAKRIAALRKPTRSAWVVNQLARSAPEAVAELARLGGELRVAQRSTDGQAIRELSQRRHRLVDGLVRQALAASGQRTPSAALRDEVAATIGAAVADPQVAEKLAEGALDRAVHREGFGAAGVLTLVTSQPDRLATPRASREGGSGPRAAAGGDRKTRGDRKTGLSADERERRRRDALAEAERQRRHDALAAAQREAAEADQAAAAATAAEREQEDAVRMLEEQLAQARLRLADTRAQARRLRAGQRRAQQALGRLTR